MLDDRKLSVLRAIVEDYVRTHEPVGSKGLVDRHSLGVSPATIRNDMAVLEEEGFIAQPHTSAGRVPTDKGYRLFVDRLSQVKPLSPAERRAIENFLAGAVDLDDVMGRSVRLLAQITRQVALVQYHADQLCGPPRRTRPAQRAPPPACPDRRHRTDRAARGGGARCPVRRRPRPPSHHAQRVGGRWVVQPLWLIVWPRSRRASTRPADLPCRSCSRRCSRPWWSATRNGS